MQNPNESLCRLLGLARRAGRLVCGMDAVLAAIRRQQAALVLVATDAAPATARKVKRCSAAADPPLSCLTWGDTAILATFSGKERTAVLAVCDVGFAAGMKKILAEILEMGEMGEMSEMEIDHP